MKSIYFQNIFEIKKRKQKTRELMLKSYLIVKKDHWVIILIFIIKKNVENFGNLINFIKKYINAIYKLNWNQFLLIRKGHLSKDLAVSEYLSVMKYIWFNLGPIWSQKQP